DLSAGCRGVSLVPLLSATAPADPELISVRGMRLNVKKYYRPYKEQRGDINLVLRQGRFKGIYNAEPGTLELYDLQADPGERNNLFATEASRAEALGAFARQWLSQCVQGDRNPPAPDSDQLDEKTLENLRSLGYID
ncbi:MAG: hypothetical protein ACE5GE_06215, partial [Phycisphaerae bacterium]